MLHKFVGHASLRIIPILVYGLLKRAPNLIVFTELSHTTPSRNVPVTLQMKQLELAAFTSRIQPYISITFYFSRKLITGTISLNF